MQCSFVRHVRHAVRNRGGAVAVGYLLPLPSFEQRESFEATAPGRAVTFHRACSGLAPNIVVSQQQLGCCFGTLALNSALPSVEMEYDECMFTVDGRRAQAEQLTL